MKFRVAAVQYKLQSIAGFADFARQVTHHVKTAAEFSADFVLFPEFLTTQLLSIKVEGREAVIEDLPNYTEQYVELFSNLARETGMHLIGGTHVIREGNFLHNVACLFYPDGSIVKQPKLHMTPTEVNEWRIKPGNSLNLFDTAWGKMAMLTCYDIEFPEIVRMARAKGANVIFCPSCTDDRHGFFRVRYCCHARTIENQVYVVTTGTIGSLPTVDFMRANYGQAAIISPNDIPFPPGGIVAQGEVNQEMVVVADLDLSLLEEVRQRGAVTTWRDRRTDLYPDWN